MATNIESQAPKDLNQANLQPRGGVQSSPRQWRDQILYFLLPDRFSDGGEAGRPKFDPADPGKYRAPDPAAWRDAGRVWQGGTLAGIRDNLGYIKDLGATAIWVGPIWRQRPDLDTYHGYAIQHFLDVDPRFGTRQDLRDLVDAAHDRNMYVILDIVINHSGNNWFYDDSGSPKTTMPYRFSPPYPLHGWRSATGTSVPTIGNVDDGVWPAQFQDPAWYSRAGQIGNWNPYPGQHLLDVNAEYRRGDFFDLKNLNHEERSDVLAALVQVYQYWVALSDCDGFRLDAVKHVTFEASRNLCGAIREYAASIGKDNFLLVGEVTGGGEMEKNYLDVFGRNIDAVLDIGDPASRIASVVKGFEDADDFFAQFYGHDILGSHRETGQYHVSILDDHDMVARPVKTRFSALNTIPNAAHQVAHAVGMQLTTLGIPCIYYGTEQAFDGSEDLDPRPVHRRDFQDRYIREAMFGATFGAFQTSGCHFFNPDHPAYVRIAALARLRSGSDMVGLTLRRGRQYLRETRPLGAATFRMPVAGQLIAWSRLLFDQEVLVALNTDGVAAQQAEVTVHAPWHPDGSMMRVLYRGDWTHAQLKGTAPSQRLAVTWLAGGRATISLQLPPAGMAVLV